MFFHRQNPLTKLGLTKFKQLRPQSVLLLKKYHFNCLCTYCNNIQILLEAINRKLTTISALSTAYKQVLKCISAQHLAELVMCEKQAGSRFHAIDCINGICEDCCDSKSKIEDHFNEAIKSSVGILKWQKWEMKEVEVTVRKDGAFKKEDRKKRRLVDHEGKLSNAVSALVKCFDEPYQGTTMRKHLFTATWQDMQFLACKKNAVKLGTAIAVYDFGQNFTTFAQNEIKTAQFGRQQITLHPISTYYLNPDGEVVRESFMISSDDLTHDNYAVDAFRRKLINHLRNVRKLNLSHLIEWSDGASHEYKSVKAFKRLNGTAKELDLQITANFYGSEHGKSDSDGETGAWKSELSKFILGNPEANIFCANDTRQFGHDYMTNVKQSEFKHLCVVKAFRTFITINNIDRSKKMDEHYAIKGTRLCIHSVRCNDPHSVFNLSCFCKKCEAGTGGCANGHVVHRWNTSHFKVKPQVQKEKGILFRQHTVSIILSNH